MADEKQSLWDSFDPHNPGVQILLLSQRVENLGKEKEDLERKLDEERTERRELDKRVAKMERSFTMGAGILIVIPIIGVAVGILVSYGKWLFKPWN